MTAERRSVEVVADWVGLDGPTPMGLLHATPSRGKEIFAFEYDEAWLASKHALALDPSLRLHQGPQHAPVGRDNFGVFLDSSPDRWGRVLLLPPLGPNWRLDPEGARSRLARWLGN